MVDISGVKFLVQTKIDGKVICLGKRWGWHMGGQDTGCLAPPVYPLIKTRYIQNVDHS